MKRFFMPSIFLIIALLAVSSCTSTETVTQQANNEEYNRLNTELTTVQKQLASRSAEYDALQAKYQDLNNMYEAAQAEKKDMNGKYQTIQAEYEGLNSKYDTLQADYQKLDDEYMAARAAHNKMLEGVAGIDEKNVEQALYELINEERSGNHLDEYQWGENLYGWALANSRNMAENQRYQYSDYASYQQIYWAIGYGTADSMAADALVIWKNSSQYEKIFLNSLLTYAAVAVYKSGDVLYITYIADTFK